MQAPRGHHLLTLALYFAQVKSRSTGVQLFRVVEAYSSQARAPVIVVLSSSPGPHLKSLRQPGQNAKRMGLLQVIDIYHGKARKTGNHTIVPAGCQISGKHRIFMAVV
jgi:hypothetical protein